MLVVNKPINEMPIRYVDETELYSHHYVILGRFQKGTTCLYQPLKVNGSWMISQIGNNAGLIECDNKHYKFKTLKECLDYFYNPHGQYEIHCFRSVRGFLEFCLKHHKPHPNEAHYEKTDRLE